MWLACASGTTGSNRFPSGGMLNHCAEHVCLLDIVGWANYLSSNSWYFIGDYRHELSEKIWLDYRLSIDILDSEFEKGTNDLLSRRDDEYYGRVMSHWQPVKAHQLAVGFEYSHETFGKPSLGYPSVPAKITGLEIAEASEENSTVAIWSADTASILAEHQWQITEKSTSFIGLRLDQNDYTSDLISGRAALVYTPNDKDTVKLIYNHSVRRTDNAESRSSELEGGDVAETEDLDNYEITYQRQHNHNFWLRVAGFYVDYDIISWNAGLQAATPQGNLNYYGLELESVY